MFLLRYVRLVGFAMALAGATVGLASTASTSLAKSPSKATTPPIKTHALLSSRELWATIDVCSPTDQPNTVGIRGSMPGDGDRTQRMFMRLQVQFQGPKGAWRFFAGTVGDSGFLAMGPAKQRKHEGGQTFQVLPAGQTATLRGVVTYEWRAADATIVRHVRRITTAGHISSAGSDPAGFSAATCTI
jgi:hypothetical protein